MCLNSVTKYQLLVGSLMVNIELDRNNHNSIPHNCYRGGLKSLDVRTELMMKEKKISFTKLLRPSKTFFKSEYIPLNR
jgi:hypothetical protein